MKLIDRLKATYGFQLDNMYQHEKTWLSVQVAIELHARVEATPVEAITDLAPELLDMPEDELVELARLLLED